MDALALEAGAAIGGKAPGVSPLSQPIWAPLQTPSTGVPSAAAARTSSITGERAAIAPARR